MKLDPQFCNSSKDDIFITDIAFQKSADDFIQSITVVFTNQLKQIIGKYDDQKKSSNLALNKNSYLSGTLGKKQGRYLLKDIACASYNL